MTVKDVLTVLFRGRIDVSEDDSEIPYPIDFRENYPTSIMVILDDSVYQYEEKYDDYTAKDWRLDSTVSGDYLTIRLADIGMMT